LFWHRNTTGDFHTAAKLSPEWKPVLLVPPSPKLASTTCGSLRCWIAYAQPVAWMMCVPIGELIEKNLIGSVNEKCTGIWRPFVESAALPYMLCIIASGEMP
jgi:hypothetical protein